MEFHEAANIFPLLTGQEYTALRDDIQATNGPIEPIILCDGKILDGRNRYTACLDLGIEPVYQEYKGTQSPLAFVISKNLHRRHLNETQRAVVASKIANMPLGGAIYRSANLQTDKVSQSEAADMLNVSPRTVASVKAVERAAPDLLPKLESGEMSAHEATKEVQNRKAIDNPALYSSDTDEWYTPQAITNKVVQVLGEIDLDPCSNSGKTIPAFIHYTKQDDGLARDWAGRVYMNPPYGREIADWVEKLCEEYESGRVSAAIALVPSRTDTEWFRRFAEYPRCFIWGRLKFGGGDNSAPFPSMAVYLGNDIEKFTEAFGVIGDVYIRI